MIQIRFYKSYIIYNINKYKFSTPTIGIIGYPNIGKSTFFNTLVKKELAFVQNLPFSTINPNKSIIKVEDKELLYLSNLILNCSNKENKDKYFIPKLNSYEVKIMDIAGIIKNSHTDNTRFLPGYDCDSFIHIIRCFEDKSIQYMDNSIDCISEYEITKTEMILSDIIKLSKLNKNIINVKNLRLINKGAKKSRKLNKEDIDITNLISLNDKSVINSATIEICYNYLNNLKFTIKKYSKLLNLKKDLKDILLKENTISNIINKHSVLNKELIINTILDELNLLSLKPSIFVLNSNMSNLINNNVVDFVSYLKFNGLESDYILTSILYEREAVLLSEEYSDIINFNKSIKEIYSLDYNKKIIESENNKFNIKYKHEFNSLNTIEKIILDKLNYIKFYTIAGKSNIISSYIIKKGSNILLAANKVHSNFANNFISADIYNIEDIYKLIDKDSNFDLLIDEAELINKNIIKKVNKNYKLDKTGNILKFNI